MAAVRGGERVEEHEERPKMKVWGCGCQISSGNTYSVLVGSRASVSVSSPLLSTCRRQRGFQANPGPPTTTPVTFRKMLGQRHSLAHRDPGFCRLARRDLFHVQTVGWRGCRGGSSAPRVVVLESPMLVDWNIVVMFFEKEQQSFLDPMSNIWRERSVVSTSTVPGYW